MNQNQRTKTPVMLSEREAPPCEALGSLLTHCTEKHLFCASRNGFAGRSFASLRMTPYL